MGRRSIHLARMEEKRRCLQVIGFASIFGESGPPVHLTLPSRTTLSHQAVGEDGFGHGKRIERRFHLRNRLPVADLSLPRQGIVRRPLKNPTRTSTIAITSNTWTKAPMV